MFIRSIYALREPEGGTSTPSPAPSPKNAAQVRQPSPDELKVEFTDDIGVGAEPEASGEPATKAAPQGPPGAGENTDVAGTQKPQKPLVAKEPPPATPKATEVAPDAGASKSVPQRQVDTTAPIVPIVPGSGQPKARDYTGFSEEQKGVLTKMSNEAFDYTTKIIKENTELAKLKGATFIQHPEAYTLDPEFKKTQEDIYYLNKEAQYWQEQLVNISEAKDWIPIVGWDAKTGEPKLGTPQKATKLAEEQVRMAMNRCYGQGEQRQQSLHQLAATYQQRVQADNAAIQQECARRFGWVADPKMLDLPVETGAGAKTVKQLREEFISLFPPYHQNTVGIDVAAHMFAALQIYGQQIRELQSGKQLAEIKTEEVLRAEPTSAARSAPGKVINGVETFDLEGLPV